MGKYVSERFKEKHKSEWRDGNPLQNDIIRTLQLKFSTEMRWEKAVQHLREAGNLTNSPKDIGALMSEVGRDAEDECRDEIMKDLFEWAWPQIKRSLPRGLPEWYKQRLARSQCFENIPTGSVIEYSGDIPKYVDRPFTKPITDGERIVFESEEKKA